MTELGICAWSKEHSENADTRIASADAVLSEAKSASRIRVVRAGDRHATVAKRDGALPS